MQSRRILHHFCGDFCSLRDCIQSAAVILDGNDFNRFSAFGDILGNFPCLMGFTAEPQHDHSVDIWIFSQTSISAKGLFIIGSHLGTTVLVDKRHRSLNQLRDPVSRLGGTCNRREDQHMIAHACFSVRTPIAPKFSLHGPSDPLSLFFLPHCGHAHVPRRQSL